MILHIFGTVFCDFYTFSALTRGISNTSMIIRTKHTGDSFVEPPVSFLCTWYLVTWSLHQRALRIIYLVPAEDEDLAVMDNLCTLYIVPLYIFEALLANR